MNLLLRIWLALSSILEGKSHRIPFPYKFPALGSRQPSWLGDWLAWQYGHAAPHHRRPRGTTRDYAVDCVSIFKGYGGCTAILERKPPRVPHYPYGCTHGSNASSEPHMDKNKSGASTLKPVEETQTMRNPMATHGAFQDIESVGACGRWMVGIRFM
ncbi:predicted protein [Histoplasma capsulatum var. duboisii H88]|uniref:Predicted protein n=1 Tax=Ajellomyces capsulatus (strain H88) TaxID=544711 RepID=F0UFE5_AJEC8|nr:predicted protein [Histoplasma capsulatum var. duboisii H88]QSS55729.1 hypothetical protein I7I53_03698 [Histoplasma capsulatum var. duboisii H88]